VASSSARSTWVIKGVCLLHDHAGDAYLREKAWWLS
jgi:hypothetical protein